MANIKPFKGIRPPQELVEEIATYPYDVLGAAEAKEEAKDKQKSFYRIIRPEVDFSEPIDKYAPQVYERGEENFKKFQEEGWLVQDKHESYYVYAQTMNKRTQYGIVVCCHVDDYNSGHIKKHELTRQVKENDRMKHIEASNANLEPVFFAYPNVDELDEITKHIISQPSEYDFVSDNEVGHQFWLVKDENIIDNITQAFAQIANLYIADGHHRTAAAVRVAQDRARANPNHTGEEEYNYFMAICFPTSHLHVMDYNRVIKDLNGKSVKEILTDLKRNFLVKTKSSQLIRPTKAHEFSIYLDGRCYYLIARAHTINDQDPVDALDVTIASRHILSSVFGIRDLRTDDRIDFVAGTKGMSQLKELVDSDQMKAALALYPSNMNQIMKVANIGGIMPLKATWFDPKPRSGLVIHKLD